MAMREARVRVRDVELPSVAIGIVTEVAEVAEVAEVEDPDCGAGGLEEFAGVGIDDREPFLASEDDLVDACEVPTLITFDPGGTTGWAVFAVHPLSLVDGEYPILDNVLNWSQGQIAMGPEGESGMIHEMAWLCASWPGAAVLAEDFILESARKNRDMLSPVRLNAGLSYALWLQNRPLIVQGRDVKAVVTDERLKAWGYYVRAGGQEHARDATRHALGFLRRAKGSGAEACAKRASAWPALYEPNGALRVVDEDED